MAPKLQSTLTPLLAEMIENPPKPQQPVNANNSPSNPEVALEPDVHHQHTAPKISVEDFIQTTQVTIATPILTSAVPKQSVEKPAKVGVLKGSKPPTTPTTTVNKTPVEKKPEKKSQDTFKQPLKKDLNTPAETSKKSIVSADLEADPTNQYR